jgi:uncharacterized protein (DUF433 family)
MLKPDRKFRPECIIAFLHTNTSTVILRYHVPMNYLEHIGIDPRIRSGKPCIRSTRIAVADIFDYLGGGMSIAEVLDDFPDLTAEDIQACFAFAADRDRRMIAVPNEIAI